jgi:hypothetical protein
MQAVIVAGRLLPECIGLASEFAASEAHQEEHTMTITSANTALNFDAVIPPELRRRIAKVIDIFGPMTENLEDKCDEAYSVVRLVEKAIESAIGEFDFGPDDGRDIAAARSSLFDTLEEYSGLNVLTGHLGMIQVLTQLPDWRVVEAIALARVNESGVQDADIDQEVTR